MRRAGATAGPAALLVVAAGWTFLSAASTGGSAAGPAAVLVASAATLALAAAVRGKERWLVPAVVVGTAVVAAIASRGEIFSAHPTKGPFSYANATGAFYLQGAIAGLMLVAAAPRSWARWVGGACSVLFVAIVVASGSRAAAALLVVPVAGYVAAGRLRAGVVAVRVMAAVLALVAVATVVLGLTYEASGEIGRGDRPGRAERIPDDRRLGLWRDALTLIRENPIVGVGPGRFATESPIASADPDARWAHHEFLQFGAETGLIGLALLSAAFAWAIGAVGSGSTSGIVSVLGVAALVVLGTGGCLDYLFHFPAIPIAASALAGAATQRFDDRKT